MLVREGRSKPTRVPHHRMLAVLCMEGLGGEAGPGHDVVEGVMMVKGEEQEREC